MGRLPRLPLMIFERTGVAGHQSLARDHVTYRDLATDRQQRAYDIVREHRALTVSRVERHNSALSDALRPVPKVAVGGWAWVYNTAVKARRRTRTPRSSRPSLRSTGRPPTTSSQLAPVPPLTPRTAPLRALSSYIRIYPPTCPARMLAGAFRYNAASPVPTPKTMATCRSMCQRGCRNMYSTISPRNPLRTVTQDMLTPQPVKHCLWRHTVSYHICTYTRANLG